MARTVSIGGLTYDLFVFIDHEVVKEKDGQATLRLPLGQKIRVHEVVGTAGGGAANTAVGLSRLGCEAACCGVVGNDQWGEELLRTLKKEKVDTAATTVVEKEPSSFSIVMTSKTGERVILNEPGTNAHLHDVTFDRERAARADWLFLNRIHPKSSVIVDDIVAMVGAAKGPRLTWNPGGAQIQDGMKTKTNATLLAVTHLLLVNKEEALAFTGAGSIDDALTTLIRAGCKNVCITDGPRGAYATDGKSRYHCPSPDVPVIDTTGAGDAFGTGATWAILSGYDLPMALRAGTINALSVVGVIGAQPGLLTDTEMHSRIEKAHLTVTSASC